MVLLFKQTTKQQQSNSDVANSAGMTTLNRTTQAMQTLLKTAVRLLQHWKLRAQFEMRLFEYQFENPNRLSCLGFEVILRICTVKKHEARCPEIKRVQFVFFFEVSGDTVWIICRFRFVSILKRIGWDLVYIFYIYNCIAIRIYRYIFVI